MDRTMTAKVGNGDSVLKLTVTGKDCSIDELCNAIKVLLAFYQNKATGPKPCGCKEKGRGADKRSG